MMIALRPIQAISDRDRRTLAVGAGCILCMILVARVVPAKRRWDARTEMRAMVLAHQVADARSLVAREKVARDALTARTRALDRVETGLIRADTKSAGEAALAALVSTVAASAGIKVDALALDADAANGGSLRSVSVTGGATGDLQGLASFLAALEHASSRVAVRALSITPSDPAAPDTRAESLRFEFTVEAQVIAAAARHS